MQMVVLRFASLPGILQSSRRNREAKPIRLLPCGSDGATSPYREQCC